MVVHGLEAWVLGESQAHEKKKVREVDLLGVGEAWRPRVGGKEVLCPILAASSGERSTTACLCWWGVGWQGVGDY